MKHHYNLMSQREKNFANTEKHFMYTEFEALFSSIRKGYVNLIHFLVCNYVTNNCDNNQTSYQLHMPWHMTRLIQNSFYIDMAMQGCDASVLLDGPKSEKTASQNWALRGFVLINKIKTVLEDRCPVVVSCVGICKLASQGCRSFGKHTFATQIMPCKQIVDTNKQLN